MLRATIASVVLFSAASALAGAEPILIDGSSTVYPISVAAAELYNAKTGIQIEVSVSGTTAGMRLFSTGKIPVAGASRPIRPEEISACSAIGLEFVELPIALDGLTIAVSAQNSFIDSFTMAELKKLWEPTSEVKSWNQIRASWPDAPIALFGASRDNGTFDYFTEVVNGKSRVIRETYTATVDPNVQVQGLVANANAQGFFGWSYYQQSSSVLKAVPIDNGHGPVAPTREHILDGSYAPFSRPLFLYVAKPALERPEIRGFLDSVLDHPKVIEDAGYVALDDRLESAIRKRLKDRVVGSAFANVTGHPKLGEIYLGGKPVPVTTNEAKNPVVTKVPEVVVPVVKAPAPTPITAAPASAITIAKPATPEPAISQEKTAVMAKVTEVPKAPAKVNVSEAVAPVVAVSIAPAAPARALTPTDLERIRAASYSLARASLEKNPDLAELRKRSQAVRDLVEAAGAGVAP